jgi:hypothetical protein
MRHWSAYSLAAAIGFGVYLLVFGVGHLMGTSPYWELPATDSRTYLAGYRYFLHEPWHWPLFEVHGPNQPYAKNIFFTDSIPLFALLNKAVATVVPPWKEFSARAYLGMWHAICYTLQACAGVAVLRSLGRRTLTSTVTGALFFLAVPAFIFRYEHASLSAQFLLLWAIALYLRTSRRSTMGWYGWWLAQLVVCALVNPYHLAMSLALFAAAGLRARNIGHIALWFPACLSAVGMVLVSAGFVSREVHVAMPGFDEASSNLLSQVIPVRSLLLGDGRSWANVEATQYQSEGYDYLGIGVLVLVAIALTLRRRDLLRTISRHRLLFVICLGAWLYSLSNHVYFGGQRVLTYEFPRWAHWLAEQYRSPARFVWLPTYVGISYLCGAVLLRPRRGWEALLAAFAIGFHVVDGGMGDWLAKRELTRAPKDMYLNHPPWKALIHAHNRVEFEPTYECMLDGTPNLDKLAVEMQYIASERSLDMNGIYSARPTRDCAADAARVEQTTPQAGTLYVFFPMSARHADRFEPLGAACGSFARGTACSLDHGAIEEAKRAGALGPAPLPPSLEVDQHVRFGAGGNAGPYLREGWSWEDPTGRFTWKESASIIAHLRGTPRSGLTLNLRGHAPLGGDKTTQDVALTFNGQPVGTLHFDESSNDDAQVRRIRIAVPMDRMGQTFLLTLRPRDVRTPRALGINGDERKLGVWIEELWFE